MRTLKKLSALAIVAVLLISCFTSLEITAAAASGDTVYFDNSVTNWSTVYCYMWKEGSSNNGQWPGVAMTKVSGNTWSYSVSGDFDKIIFNVGGDSHQSSDLDYAGNNKIAKPNSADNKFTVSWSDYSGGGDNQGGGSGSSSGSVYVKSTWGNVNCYMWNSDEDKNAAWPGEPMTSVGNGVFSYTPSKSFANVIFNNGTDQTGDLVFPGTGKIYDNGTWSDYSPSGDNQGGGSQGGGSQGGGSQGGGSDNSGTTYNPGGSSSSSIGGDYSTNPNGQVGARKTISVDGDKSDWDSSMLIAQGLANDDPRVYAHWSMHEIPIDDYAMYAAWDDNNLYIMYEMANVQDVAVDNLDGLDFPISQGNLWIYNLPVFMYVSTGKGNVTHGETAGGTLWDSGITVEENCDHVIAFSTNASNGPFIYTANESGKLEPDTLVNKSTGISIKWGNGQTLSGKLYGAEKAGGDNRKVGDTIDGSASIVDFYTKNHKASLDMFYEMSIPLSGLGITASDIANNGIGIIKVSTFGTSGMDCLPYDSSMQDNAAQPYSKDEATSAEKEDSDKITVPLARIGKALSGSSSNQGSGNNNQGSGNENQGSGNENQGSGNENQGSGNENQGSGNENQGSGNNNQGSGNENQGSGGSTPGSITPAPSLTASVKLNGNQVQSIDVTGNSLTVTYNLTASKMITDGDLSLSYDSSKLTLASVDTPNITTGKTTSMKISDNPYLINFTGVDTATKSGIYNFKNGAALVKASFNVVSGASGSTSVNLTVNELDALENSVTTAYFADSAATSDGNALVASLSAPTVTQSGNTVPVNPDPVNPSNSENNSGNTSESNTPGGSGNTDNQPNPSTPSVTPGSSDSNQGSDTNKTTIKLSVSSKKIYVGHTTTIKSTTKNGVGYTTFSSSDKSVATINEFGIVKGLKAGRVVISAKNNGVVSKITITVAKRINPVTVKAKTITAKANKTKKFSKSTAFKIRNAKGKLVFSKVKGNKKITINKKTGKITVKKGLKKATYKVVFKVTAKGNATYKPKTKKVTVKVTVK